MNREIKFRGKSVDNGKWVYGWVFGDKAKSIIEIDKEYPNEYGVEAYYTSVVIPETVGQYTGLKDKNGVEVYEGDICKSDEYIHVIKIGEFAPTWLNMIFDKISMKRHSIYGVYAETKGEYCIIETGDAFEVIGNIYENPELLEVE